MKLNLRVLNATPVLLPLVLLMVASCSTTEDAGDASSSEDTATSTEDNSLTQAPPDPAFDPLLSTLQEMTTAPIMLPATLPFELKNAVIASDTQNDNNPYNDALPLTTHSEKYTILFLNPNGDPNQIIQDYAHYRVGGTLIAEPASTLQQDPSKGGAKVIQLDDVTLPDGTVADLKRVEPPEGTNVGRFSLGTFEEEGYRYTLRIEFADTPEGDLARQALSTMVKVSRT